MVVTESQKRILEIAKEVGTIWCDRDDGIRIIINPNESITIYQVKESRNLFVATNRQDLADMKAEDSVDLKEVEERLESLINPKSIAPPVDPGPDGGDTIASVV